MNPREQKELLDENSHCSSYEISYFGEKNKEIRLNTIKSQILTYLGFAGRPTPVVNSTEEERQQMMDMYEKMKHSASHPASDSFTEKVQSFYPTCDLPRNTTSDLWNNNGTVMNLFFNNIQAVLSTSNVLKAKLRLYKHSRSAENLVVAEEGCTHNQDEKKKGDGETKTVEDRLIRVSIYWYTRPLKKSKDKKKLLDSQMLSIYGEEWTEWNIKPAVKAWKETPSKNFGLSVIVEDEDGVKLPVDKLFAAMNCSNEASTARPFPGFFVHPNRENVEFQSGGQVSLPWAGSPAYNTPVFPIIDLCSVSNETDKHKLRHHNHHREQRSH
ncbi:hypothetical protein M8J77_020965 [Diaphorina citri]|nr:hypothetical protein M8J77_020965 [Diaphorina citri]